jgi:pyruvate dehydrogenase (quinone)
MSMNVSEFVWHRLQEWGLKRVYGYPGDGIGGLDVALQKTKNSLQYIQVRHEEMAAFMASAHAKFTGEVGLCYATSGPGAIHLLNGLYDAKMDHVPVVAIVGQQARTAIGASYQQEVDLQSLFKDVAGDFVATAILPGQVPRVNPFPHPHAREGADGQAVVCPLLRVARQRDGSRQNSIGVVVALTLLVALSAREAANNLNSGKEAANNLNSGKDVSPSWSEAFGAGLGWGSDPVAPRGQAFRAGWLSAP